MTKRWLVLIFALVALVMAACAPSVPEEGAAPAIDEAALEEAQDRIAELEAALEDAAESGVAEEELEALQEELSAAQSEAEAAAAEAEAAAEEAAEAQAAQCTYNAYRMGWVMDWADAGNIVDSVFGPTSDFQYTFWQSTNEDAASQFSDMVASAYRETDLDTRSTTWQEAEQILIDDVVAVLPLFHYDRTTLVATTVDPLFPPFGAPRLADWSFNNGDTTMDTAIGTAVPTLDIQRSTDTTSSFMIYQLIDAPYKFNEEGGIEPLAAESFEVSEDGTVFTVHLREDATWSDGEPVTAQHFVDGINRLLSPDLANDYAYVMFDIVDAEAYNAGEVDSLESVQVVDDYTFTFELSEPRSYFDSILAFSTFHPVRLDVIEANPDSWTQPGNFVSNGAYVLDEHNPGENLVFTKNPEYWDGDNVQIETVNVSVIAEPATALAAFENGQLDWLGGASFPPEDTPRLVEEDFFVRTPRPGTYYVAFNTAQAPTDSVAMRRALSSSVDRDVLINSVLQQPWTIPAFGVIPPEITGHQADAVGYGFDPEAAQGYLQEYMGEAGVEDAGSVVLELWYNKGGSNQQVLEAVEAMWEETLGIDVRTVNVEWATYLETLEECNVIGGGGF